MQRKFSVSLASGAVTDVFFSSSMEDLAEGLSEYGDNVFYIFDENSAALLPSVPQRSVVLESGEVHKNMRSLEMIIEKALSMGAARDTRFIGFGGGVVCDMAALASSLYMRGTRLTLVPTTLLCMVDASVGGKSAIDYLGGKNLIGTFYPAEDVIICADTLRSLPDSEFRCGMGEVVKHAFLTEDAALFDFLKTNGERIMAREDRDLLDEIVLLSLRVKCSYIERDPLEKKGIRSFLNLGHTFAHALESMEGYGISHGEAVAWGLGRALEGSFRKKLISSDFLSRGLSLLEDYGYDIGYRIESGRWDSFSAALRKDKKKSGTSVKYVLLSGLGKPLLMPLEDDLVRKLCLKGSE